MRFNIDKSSSIPRNMVEIKPKYVTKSHKNWNRVLKQATRQLHSRADQNTFKFYLFFKFQNVEKKLSNSF